MKKFISGFVVGALLCSSATLALASTGSQTIKATYKNIKVAVDGVIVSLTDANGKTVEPFVYNGTTYLPVRGVATALNQQVSWDGSTNTVYIGKQPEANSTTATPTNTVILDKNGIKITYLGYKRHSSSIISYDEYEFKVENSNSEEWSYYSDDALLDDVQASYMLGGTILPGKTSYDSIILYDDTLRDKYHISSYDKLTFEMRLYPTNDWLSTYKSGAIEIVK